MSILTKTVIFTEANFKKMYIRIRININIKHDLL